MNNNTTTHPDPTAAEIAAAMDKTRAELERQVEKINRELSAQGDFMAGLSSRIAAGSLRTDKLFDIAADICTDVKALKDATRNSNSTALAGERAAVEEWAWWFEDEDGTGCWDDGLPTEKRGIVTPNLVYEDPRNAWVAGPSKKYERDAKAQTIRKVNPANRTQPIGPAWVPEAKGGFGMVDTSNGTVLSASGPHHPCCKDATITADQDAKSRRTLNATADAERTALAGERALDPVELSKRNGPAWVSPGEKAHGASVADDQSARTGSSTAAKLAAFPIRTVTGPAAIAAVLESEQLAEALKGTPCPTATHPTTDSVTNSNGSHGSTNPIPSTSPATTSQACSSESQSASQSQSSSSPGAERLRYGCRLEVVGGRGDYRQILSECGKYVLSCMNEDGKRSWNTIEPEADAWFDPSEVADALSKAPPPPGYVEPLPVEGEKRYGVFVKYVGVKLAEWLGGNATPELWTNPNEAIAEAARMNKTTEFREFTACEYIKGERGPSVQPTASSPPRTITVDVGKVEAAIAWLKKLDSHRSEFGDGRLDVLEEIARGDFAPDQKGGGK